MTKAFRVLRRAALLLLIWAVAALLSARAVSQAMRHHQLARETSQLNTQYQQLVTEYADKLAEGERIASDHDYQIELLKKRFGYTSPDETPIVILREDPASPPK